MTCTITKWLEQINCNNPRYTDTVEKIRGKRNKKLSEINIANSTRNFVIDPGSLASAPVDFAHRHLQTMQRTAETINAINNDFENEQKGLLSALTGEKDKLKRSLVIKGFQEAAAALEQFSGSNPTKALQNLRRSLDIIRDILAPEVNIGNSPLVLAANALQEIVNKLKDKGFIKSKA